MTNIGIATRYWTSGDRTQVGGPDFPHPSRPSLGPIQPPIQWVQSLFQAVKRPGRGVDHPPPTSAIWAFVACSRVNFTFHLLHKRKNNSAQHNVFAVTYEQL